MGLDSKSVFSAIEPLVSAGFAIHWLRENSKAPAESSWSDAPVATLSDLKASHFQNANVGVRLGEFSRVSGHFLHLIDVDIRDAAQAADAWRALDALWPDRAGNMPIVRSGSGGESRHVYFMTDRPFRSKKLAHSETFAMVYDPKKGRDVKKWDWEIELFGTGKQAVIPPSIHPDTQKPYVWDVPFDFDMVEMGLGPLIPAALVRSWAPQREEVDDTEVKPALGMTISAAREALKYLPLGEWCDDRDGWLQVGMALHHEFSGSSEGLGLWNEFSKQSTKFDPRDQERVWESFRAKPNSIRMATIVKASEAERFQSLFDEEEEAPQDQVGEAKAPGESIDDEIEALLGPVPSAAATEELDWRSKLDRNEEGAIKPTLPNLVIIIANDPRTKPLLAFNEFAQEIVFRAEPGKLKLRRPSPKGTAQLDGRIWHVQDPVNGDLWSDSHDNAVRAILETPTRQGGYSLKVTDRDQRAAVDIVAQKNGFHPVREFLNSLKWDGVSRIETYLHRYLGVPDDAYSRAVARLILLGAVVRIFEPGHKFDFVPILEGMQGKRKSTFIEIIAKNWFSELDGDFHDRKEMVEKMMQAWICELPELQGFTKAEVTQIKAFVSTTADKVRLAYARRAQIFKRQCVFIGSTNEKEYLRDSTGGRRFWPIECHVDEIDTEKFRGEVDDLWAEAVHIYRQMRVDQPYGMLPLYLSNANAATAAKRLQESRRVETVEDGIAGRISAWLDEPVVQGFDDESDEDLLIGGKAEPKFRNQTCLMQIWVECLGNDPRSYDQRAAQIVGRAIKLVEDWYPRGFITFGNKYGRQRAYWRKGSDPFDA